MGTTSKEDNNFIYAIGKEETKMDFKKVAKKMTTASPVMEGRTKVSMDTLIQRGGEVTITEFDFMHDSNKGESYPVFTTKEYPGEFCFGGTVLMNICEAWVARFEGDIERCSNELKASGGVQMKFTKGKTKNGRDCTTVTVIE